MQVSAFTDYALRVLLFAAVRPDERCLTQDVSAAFGISRHHVVKVVNALGRLGYVDTTRGRGGGFRLGRPAARIGVGDVVRRTEGLTLVECFEHRTNTCPLARACGLKNAFKEAEQAFLAVLDRYTLADLVAAPRWAAPLSSLRIAVTERTS